ncbi:MAG: hypothetical protein ACK5HA_05980 [Planctomycetaceae bacterium]|jgi:mannose-6-phosphate isomerase-like protein (cupin superfamily)
MHANYARLVELSHAAHLRGRSLLGLDPRDIALARLYSYSFRAHTIGVFHATASALPSEGDTPPAALPLRTLALQSLAELASQTMDPIPRDGRALVSTFHLYHQRLTRVETTLDLWRSLYQQPKLNQAASWFSKHIDTIRQGSGLHTMSDLAPLEQASFTVPNLGITICPLVYGDFHSWNLAWLPEPASGVPCHQHAQGVEIHLGYGPLHGATILGDAEAEVREGYAMPIPPGTRHGYVNRGPLPHHVPFVFGSFHTGGWGVFLDVEPQPPAPEQLTPVAVTSRAMRGTILLERELERAAQRLAAVRYQLIPARVTDRHGTGGLELSVARVTPRGTDWRHDEFAAVSVVRGRGELVLAGETRPLAPHDHFGLPGGLTAHIRQTGTDPLVLLDVILKPGESSGRFGLT